MPLKKWLIILLITLSAAAGLAALAYWGEVWLPPLLAFAGANSNTIQGVTGIIQLILWLGSPVAALIGGWLARREAQSNPASNSSQAGAHGWAASQTGSGTLIQAERVDQSETKIEAQGKGSVAAHEIRGPVLTGDYPTYIERQELSPETAQARFDQLRQRYLTGLAQRCQVLPLAALGGDEEAGEEVSLADVYIALDTLSHRSSSETDRATKRDEVWLARQEEDPLSALEAATQTSRLALLGDPGSGKSTFVRQLAAWLAQAQLGEREALPGWPTETWPLLTTLRDLATRLTAVESHNLSDDERDRRLVEAVRGQWQADFEALGVAELGDSLEDVLRSGQVLLIFDGLDEVATQARHRVRQAVQAVLNIYPAVAHLIVTCRVRSYSGATVLPGFTAQTLAPFDEQKINRFIAAWYEAQGNLGRFDRAGVERNRNDLQQAVRDRTLHELAANPMLLTTMAIVHQREVGLPRERVRLYHLAVQVLLTRWQKRKGGVASERLQAVLLDDLKLRAVLERLAYEAHHLQGQRGPEADLSRQEILGLLEQPPYFGDVGLADQFLDYVDQRAGLLVGRGSDESGHKPPLYTFPHRTFQEYLAGCHMVSGRAVEREFWRRVKAGDYWYLAGQLGAEELLYNRRDPERLLDLAYHLCPPSEPGSESGWRAVLWSGQMAVQLGRTAIQADEDADRPDDGAAYLERLIPRLRQVLAETRLSQPLERAEAGRVLAKLGDPRPAVGLDPETGLPDIAWCKVPAGDFLMGSDPRKDPQARDNEQPQHTLTLPAYKISRYPVTNAHYRAFVDDGGYSDRWRHCWTEAGWDWMQGESRQGPKTYGSPFDLANHPAVGVSWYEAVAFCRWLTERLREIGRIGANEVVRLPTEAEWEKAARGTEGRIYPWGNAWDSNLANARETGLNSSSAVGCFPGGVSPYDCQDMSGNVFEWCSTVWDEDAYPYQINDEWSASYLDGTNVRVLRGGSWDNANTDHFRVSYRWNVPNDWASNGGFRLALSS